MTKHYDSYYESDDESAAFADGAYRVRSDYELKKKKKKNIFQRGVKKLVKIVRHSGGRQNESLQELIFENDGFEEPTGDDNEEERAEQPRGYSTDHMEIPDRHSPALRSEPMPMRGFDLKQLPMCVSRDMYIQSRDAPVKGPSLFFSNIGHVPLLYASHCPEYAGVRSVTTAREIMSNTRRDAFVAYHEKPAWHQEWKRDEKKYGHLTPYPLLVICTLDTRGEDWVIRETDVRMRDAYLGHGNDGLTEYAVDWQEGERQFSIANYKLAGLCVAFRHYLTKYPIAKCISDPRCEVKIIEIKDKFKEY